MAKLDDNVHVSVVYSSPIGPIRITADPIGITQLELQFGKKYHSKLWSPDVELSGQPNARGVDLPMATATYDLSLEQVLSSDGDNDCCRHLKDCINWLNVYFKGEFDKLKLTPFPQLKPLALDNESFNAKIWRSLVRVEAGRTVTYSELATLAVDNPKAARAAGNAVRSHHIPILIPCHRVVKKGGQLGNYSGGDGLETKEWLLKHEQ